MSYDALKRLLSEATQGTWRLEGDQRIVDIGGSTVARGPLLFTKEDRANLELIAALRNAAPALLAENERLRAALEKYADGSNWGSADYTGMVRAFTHRNRSWYAQYLRHTDERCVDEVMFGYYSPDGGTSGEMAMRWYNLDGDTLTPRLEVYCDAWHALSTFRDVMVILAEQDGKDISPAAFCAILVGLGFKDQTEEVRGEEGGAE